MEHFSSFPFSVTEFCFSIILPATKKNSPSSQFPQYIYRFPGPEKHFLFFFLKESLGAQWCIQCFQRSAS